MVVDDKKTTQRRVYPTFAEGYKLIECVGRGSEGSVWRAMCIPTKKDVAIKIIDLESLPSASIAEMHQQIQAMYSCSQHSHVVRYYTSFVHGTSLWCVMKYLSGGSCSDIMRLCHPSGLEEAAIKIILKDTLKALDYFHQNGRIHRDIKAGNIIISETGSVKVADFGVSGSLLVEQLRTTLCGSPCWMAPEVMLRAWKEGREQSDGYDFAVDIWSLGITALELAKGRPPFAEFAPSRVFSMVVQNPPPALDDETAQRKKFSANFKDFVSLCLQKDPASRPNAAKLLKHKFFKGKKSREYLVSTVLADLPSQSERSSMMSINQALPVMQPSGASDKAGWNFDDQSEDPIALLAESLESATFLGTSTTSQQSIEDHESDGSSCDESFFDEYFGAAPSNTMHCREFSRGEFEGLPPALPPATPANTMQARDFSAADLPGFPSAAPPATPSNTMQAQDFTLENFANFPGLPPATPANTMQPQDFALEGFAEFPSGRPPATPANTMQGHDFALEHFAKFPSSLPPATPANTLQAGDFAKTDFADFPTSSSPIPPTPSNTMQSRDFAKEEFYGLPSVISPAPTPANTMQSGDFEEEIFPDFPVLGQSYPSAPTPMNTLEKSHFLDVEDISYATSDDESSDDEF
jgi:serine/threonine-protein kinase OSR1/STK39